LNGRPALLDVNVPMYAAGRPHPYRESCVRIMTEIAEGRLDAAIDAETIQEILYRFGAQRQWPIGAAMATNLLDIVPRVLPITAADARLSVVLFREYGPGGVQARDLVHVAVMQNNRLDTIISADAHFDRIAGIRRLDPRTLLAGPEALPAPADEAGPE
jgi:predicted nucleic acid-binding protein